LALFLSMKVSKIPRLKKSRESLKRTKLPIRLKNRAKLSQKQSWHHHLNRMYRFQIRSKIKRIQARHQGQVWNRARQIFHLVQLLPQHLIPHTKLDPLCKINNLCLFRKRVVYLHLWMSQTQ
jgi:hypothetical protein